MIFALGYKYDFVNNVFVKTGSIQIKANKSADVYLNDELIGKTSFLGNSFSQTRLLPRTYNFRLQGLGYFNWEKNIDIMAGYLVEYPVVVLLPTELMEEIIGSTSLANTKTIRFDKSNGLALISNGLITESIRLSTGQKLPTASPRSTPTAHSSPTVVVLSSHLEDNLIESPDGQKALWFNEHEIWIKWLSDSDYQPYRKKNNVELITRFANDIKDVQWYRDSSHVLANVSGILKFIEIDTRGGINSYDVAIVNDEFLYDSESDSIYKFEGSELMRIKLKK